MSTQIILIDNFDSFTYNLVDQFRSDGNEVCVFRNNVSVEVVEAALSDSPETVLVFSPGPGHPRDAGCMPQLIKNQRGKIPIIGICLGHQAIIEAYGGKIGNANEVFHGKPSMVKHTSAAMFAGLPCPLQVARYHSLAGTQIPNELEVAAELDGTIMAVLHEKERVCGFQFHPESIMTPQGRELLQNTLRWALRQDVNSKECGT